MGGEKGNQRKLEVGEPVARGLAFLLLSQGTFLACGYVIHVYLARRLGPLDYGIFGFIIAVLTWVEILAYGSSNLAVKYIQSWPERFSTWKSLFFQAQCWITAGLFSPLAGVAVVIGLLSGKYGFLFLIAFLDLLFIGFYQLYLGYLNGFRLYRRQAAASIAYSVSKVCGMVVLVELGLGVRGALLGNIISSLAGLLVGFLLFRPFGVAVSISRLAPGEEGPGKTPVTEIIRKSFIFALVPLMVNFVLNLDLWVVNFLRGGSEVGYYVSAGTLSRTVFFLFSAIFMATFPAIVSSFRTGTTSQRTRRLFGLCGDFFMVVAVPFALAIGVNGRQLVTLFYGEAYLPAGTTTSILSLAMIFLTVFVFLIYVLYAAGEYRRAVRTLVYVVFLDIITAPLLVLAAGIRGGAMATTVVSLAGFFLSYRSVKGKLTLWWDWRRAGKTTLLCCLSFLPLLLIPRDGLVFIPLSLVAFLVYYIVLFNAGIIERSEMEAAFKSVVLGI